MVDVADVASQATYVRCSHVQQSQQIAEIGSHREFLDLGGLYAQFWARESGGFICTDAEDSAAAE